jgi:tetratricopeptide (TPR) repeat protein
VYNNLGTAFIYKGKIKKAIEYYQESIREKPDNAEAVANLKNASINQKNLKDRLAGAQESMKADPQNPTLHTKLGDLYRQLGEYDEAIVQYNKAVSIQSNLIQPMYGLVLVYSHNQEYTKALDVLQNIRKKQSGNPEVYYNIACIYAKQNRTDESIVWLKQSIEKGFHNWDLIKKDPDLLNIRENSYVKKLIESHKNVLDE